MSTLIELLLLLGTLFYSVQGSYVNCGIKIYENALLIWGFVQETEYVIKVVASLLGLWGCAMLRFIFYFGFETWARMKM